MARRKRSEEKEARRFGAILAILLGAFSAFSLWRVHPWRAGITLAGAAVVLGFTFLAFPLWLRFFRRWMQFALALSWVMTRVLLSLFFYLILTPFGLALRLLGKAPLDLAWKDGRPSYWIDKTPDEFTLERYRKPY